LNPVTMEAFDQYSRTINPIEFIDTSAFDDANQCGSQEVLTQSCITIVSSQECKENMIGECSWTSSTLFYTFKLL